MGLYYPFIQFRSDTWLKLAALYWDRIARIVPPYHALQDSETVKRLQGELGLVTNLAPSAEEMDSISNEFLNVLEAHSNQLSKLYNVHGQALADEPWPKAWSNAAAVGRTPGKSIPGWKGPIDPSALPDVDPRLSYIFSEGKMTPRLEEALIEADLGVVVKDRGLIGLHPKLAFVYMNALASKMATPAMFPLTDEDVGHVLTGYTADRIIEALMDRWDQRPFRMVEVGETGHLELEFALLAIKSVIPKSIDSIPVQKIIDIRRRHSEELTAFQQASQKISETIPEAITSGNPEAFTMYLQTLYDKTLEPELIRLRKSLRRSGIDTVFGAMSVKVQVPQLLTSGAAIMGIGAMHLNPLFVGAGAIVLCFIPRVRSQRQEAQRLRKASPAAYLLKLQEELKPAILALNLGDGIGFI